MPRTREYDGPHVRQGEGGRCVSRGREEGATHVIEGGLDDAIGKDGIVFETDPDRFEVSFLGKIGGGEVHAMEEDHLFGQCHAAEGGRGWIGVGFVSEDEGVAGQTFGHALQGGPKDGVGRGDEFVESQGEFRSRHARDDGYDVQIISIA